MSLVLTAEELLKLLASEGGVIVSTASLSDVEISQARACGRMFVAEDGTGFVHKPNCTVKHNLPSDFKQRVLIEKIDLDNKATNLTKFMSSVDFMALHANEQYRLARQLNAMLLYSNVLKERIEAFTI